MCGWRHSESPLICPCLLSPWPPDSHYSVVRGCVRWWVCVRVCVCEVSDCVAGGLINKDVWYCDTTDSNKMKLKKELLGPESAVLKGS